LIANGSVVLDGATIGAKALVAAGSVVAAGTTVPPGMLFAGAPAALKRPVKGTGAEVWVATNPEAYAELARRHHVGIRYVDPHADAEHRSLILPTVGSETGSWERFCSQLLGVVGVSRGSRRRRR